MSTQSNAGNFGLSEKTFRLVLSAVMIALATVLSLIPFFQMPLGGSMTICSMLPILLVGYRNGPRWGLATGFAFAVVQLLIDLGKLLSWGLTPQSLVGSFFFDYLIAFTFLGLAGIYGKGFWKYILGMVTAVFLRFCSHVLSGVIFFSSYAADKSVPDAIRGHVWLYSIAYNGAYLLPDLLLCLIVGAILYRPLKRFIEV